MGGAFSCVWILFLFFVGVMVAGTRVVGGASPDGSSGSIKVGVVVITVLYRR